MILTSSVVTALINIGWKYYEINNSFRNAKYMQISNYYRESSGSEMHSILEKWTELLFFMQNSTVLNKMQDKEYVLKLLNDTYLYSSPETCARLANYQQHSYKNMNKSENDKFVVIILVAGIIVSLKHDFTGEWVSIQETLKIRLTDYEKIEDKLTKAIKYYKYDK